VVSRRNPRKKLRPVSHPHGCKTISFASRFSNESLSKKQRDTWIPSNEIQNQTLYWLWNWSNNWLQICRKIGDKFYYPTVNLHFTIADREVDTVCAVNKQVIARSPWCVAKCGPFRSNRFYPEADCKLRQTAHAPDLHVVSDSLLRKLQGVVWKTRESKKE